MGARTDDCGESAATAVGSDTFPVPVHPRAKSSVLRHWINAIFFDILQHSPFQSNEVQVTAGVLPPAQSMALQGYGKRQRAVQVGGPRGPGGGGGLQPGGRGERGRGGGEGLTLGRP